MSLAELVFAYATVALLLIGAMVLMIIRGKASGKPLFGRANWRFPLALRPDKMLTAEMWLLLSIAAFIALCAGVIIVIFVLPYGTAWAVAAVLATVAGLFGFMPRVFK